MGVKIESEGHDYNDALRKLGGLKPAPFLAVNSRPSDDYGRTPNVGCIVEVHGKVTREFEDVESALEYIAKTLREAEERAKQLRPRD